MDAQIRSREKSKSDRIDLKAFAKINLTLDVKGLLENGFHQVEMIMQQILLCDEVSLKWTPGGEGFGIKLSTNRRYLPTDERNLAYKAAQLMNDNFGPCAGELLINIKKRIPVAAGLAGGSSNGAAVLHGLNVLWALGLDVRSLCELGAELGSDVPFCVMGQAAADENLSGKYRYDPRACHCAVATGSGTELRPIKGLKSHLALSKPSLSISTAAAYKGIDEIAIPKHPNTEEMVKALEKENSKLIKKNLINVLENYALKEYPTVVYTKDKMQEMCKPDSVLMSGSGPTLFALCESRSEAQRVCETMKTYNRESFWTRTTY